MNFHTVKFRTVKFLTGKYLPLLLLAMLLQGCGSIFGGSDAPEPTPTRAYALVPTFTPTAVGEAPPATPTLAAAPTATDVITPTTEIVLVATETATETVSGAVSETITETATAQPPAVATTQPASAAKLTVSGEIINVRSGPATVFETIGTATKGESFSIIAKNAAGDWWQICCIADKQGWVFAQLATVENVDAVAIAPEIPTPVQPTVAPVAEAATAVPQTEPTAAAQPVPQVAAPLPAVDNGSAGDFNPNAAYQIVNFRVLGMDENNGGIRDSRAQHMIFVTVLDQNGNGVDGAVVENLVGDKSQTVMGSKGPGKAELTMYYDSFKLRVLSDPSGPVTSQVSNQMGLAFPHLPDLVGRLGGLDYEYAVCPTIDVKCSWPIQGVHYSYEITFQKVK